MITIKTTWPIVPDRIWNRKPPNDNFKNTYIYLDEASAIPESTWEVDRVTQCYALCEALFTSLDEMPVKEAARILKHVPMDMDELRIEKGI